MSSFSFLLRKNTQTKQKKRKKKEINRVGFSTVHGRVFVFVFFSLSILTQEEEEKKTSFQKEMLKKRIIRKSGHAPKNPHTRDASSRLDRAPFSFFSISTPAASCYTLQLVRMVGGVRHGGGFEINKKKEGGGGKKYTLILPQAIGFIVREKEHGVQG